MVFLWSGELWLAIYHSKVICVRYGHREIGLGFGWLNVDTSLQDTVGLTNLRLPCKQDGS